MADKSYSGSGGIEAGVPNTKLRAEQIKSEDGYTSLAVDLEALRGQVADIIGVASYKENISGYDVQLAELNPHLSGSYSGDTLKVKQKLEVTGDAQFKANIDVDVQATLASANVQDLTSGRVVTAGANGELQDSANLTFDGTDLTMASAKVSDLTDGRVVYAGASGALVDSGEMTFGAGGLTLVKDLTARSGSFGGDVTISGNLLVSGDTVTVNVGELTVEDKNILIANVATPSDATANGAGITIKGTTDKTILWVDASDSFEFSEPVVAPSGSFTNLASRLAKSTAQGKLVNAEITDFVQGTANQVIVGAVDGSGMSTLSLPQSIHTDADVEFDSLKLGDNVADAGKALKIGAAGEVIAAAWDEFVAIEANVGLELVQSGFKAEIGLAQDIRTSASPEFAALNLGAYGDLLAAGSDFKISAAAKLFSADNAFGGAAGGTWTTGLALSKDAASWDALWNAYGMGSKGQLSLVEILTAASPSTTRRLVLVKSVAGAASPDFIVGAADLADFPVGAANYQGGKADVYVNGQKQVEGPTADFEFAAAAGVGEKVKIAFKYNLQVGDVVELIRYPAASK